MLMGAAVSALCLQCVSRLQIVSLYGVSEHAAGVGCQSTHCDLQVGTTVGVVDRCGVGDPAANGVNTPCLLGRSATDRQGGAATASQGGAATAAALRPCMSREMLRPKMPWRVEHL